MAESPPRKASKSTAGHAKSAAHMSGDTPASGSTRARQQLQRSIPTMAGTAGFLLGLLNVYPTLYPWVSTADKIFGILVCALLSAVGARATHLSGRGHLDALLAALILLLLAVIALAAIPLTAGATIGSP